MSELKRLLQHAALAASIAVVAGATLLPALFPTTASAAQITARSITLSTSAPSATGVTYGVTFTPVTTTQELIVDFCANSPLLGDTCSYSAATTPVTTGAAASAGSGASYGTGAHTMKVTGLTMTGGTPFSINLTGIANPTTAVSFYARIVTFGTGNATGYLPATTTGGTPTSGTFVDNGGDALATASNISITAKVFETLSFCVFQTSCGTAPTLTLGDPTTGALSTSNAYINSNAQYTLATNAGSGVGVTMAGTTLCRTSGGSCVTGASGFTISSVTTANAGSGTANAAKTVGAEQFGMCADTTGSAALAAQTPYIDTVNACHTLTTGIYAGTSTFGFNDLASANGTNNAAGSLVLKSTAAVPSITDSFVFIGNVAPTTEAGIYTTSLNMVATSTF